ncbi:hypothetical protein B7463_g8514, partial [Scytalidium lignicola]
MSDVQKPVEATAAAPAVKIRDVGVFATEIHATESPNDTHADATKAAAVTTDVLAEKPKKELTNEEAKEVTAATDGIQGYNAPGFVKALRFSRRYFYFSEKPVQRKQLFVFIQIEKPSVINQMTECTSKTSKSFKKTTSTNIFNLANVSDVTKEGSTGFQFEVNGLKYTFQASNNMKRDSWVTALEEGSADAKAEKEIATFSGVYKARLERLITSMRRSETNETVMDESAPTEDNSNAKIHSKAKIFTIFSGKKEEDKKEGTKKDTPEESNLTTGELAVESADAVVIPSWTSAKSSGKEVKKTKSPLTQNLNRGPIFGNLLQNISGLIHRKSKEEATAFSETTTISSTAPHLENPFEESTLELLKSERATTLIEAEASKDARAQAETQPVKLDEERNVSIKSLLSLKSDELESISKNVSTTNNFAEEASKATETSATIADGPADTVNVTTTSLKKL